MRQKIIYSVVLCSLAIITPLTYKYMHHRHNETIITQGIGAVMFESLAKVGGRVAEFGAKVLLRNTAFRAAYTVAKEAMEKYFAETAVEKITRQAARESIEGALLAKGKTLSSKTIQGLLDREAMAPFLKKLVNNPIFVIVAYLPVGMALGVMTMWEDNADAVEFQRIDQQRQTIEQNFDNFMNDAQENQQTILYQLSALFEASQESIGQQYGLSGDLMQKQVETLNRSMNIAMPKEVFLIDHVTFDKVFAHAPMITPDGVYTWYNVSQYGDWQFNGNSNSFVQNKLQPFYNDQDPTNPEYAQNNAIFTEYTTDSDGYEIETEFTLYRVQYPFFAGIIFNKARWLSGSPERTRQYRLLGLYGTKNDSQATVGVHFGQTIIRTDENDEVSITTPIKQITDPESQTYTTLSQEQVQQLDSGSISFMIKIRTMAASVQFKIWPKGETSEQTTANEPLEYTTIDNLESFSFLYGGIGFMAPGCVAEFSIKKPESMQYSSEQVAAFTTKIETMLQERNS